MICQCCFVVLGLQWRRLWALFDNSISCSYSLRHLLVLRNRFPLYAYCDVAISYASELNPANNVRPCLLNTLHNTTWQFLHWGGLGWAQMYSVTFATLPPPLSSLSSVSQSQCKIKTLTRTDGQILANLSTSFYEQSILALDQILTLEISFRVTTPKVYALSN